MKPFRRTIKIPKEEAARFLRRLVPQILIQSGAIILTAYGSYMLMTWIVADLFLVTDTYLAATLEALGTLVLMILVLVFTNTHIYRRRLKEIDTLTQAISSVSSGNLDYRIQIAPHEPMTDIYSRFNRMTEELSSVQILRNDFINNYSHEFKTPIASINGFAELLLEKKLPENVQKAYLEIIRDESERLSSLAKNTIMLSKISSQKLVADPETYNLAEQLRQCSIICSGQWLEKNQEFSAELEDVMFKGNRELMQHLWINLLGNAIKYTPEAGQITVTLKKEGKNAVVCIRDTGEGMSEETVQHLFEPYYQADSSRSTQGLGLGLAIAGKIVELCGGSIDVQTQLNQGSTFAVTLPLEHRFG